MNNYQRYFIFILLFIFKIDFSASAVYRMDSYSKYFSELPTGQMVYVVIPAYLYHRNAKIIFQINANWVYSPGSSYAYYKLSDKENLSDSEAMDKNDRIKLTFTENTSETIFDGIYIKSSTNFVVIIFSGSNRPIGDTTKISGSFRYSIEFTFPIQRMETTASGTLSFSGEKEKSYFYEMKLEVGQIKLNVITKLLLEKFFYLTAYYSYSEDQMLEAKDYNYLSYKSQNNGGIYNYSLTIINKDVDIKYLILKIIVPIHSDLVPVTVNKAIVDIPDEPKDNDNNSDENSGNNNGESSGNNNRDNSGNNNKQSENFQSNNNNNTIFIIIIIILLVIIILLCIYIIYLRKNYSKSEPLVEQNSNDNKNNEDIGVN